MPKKLRLDLLQIKTFFEEKDKIDNAINSFLFSKKIGQDDFFDEWILFEKKNKVYCFVRIYFNEKIPAG